MCNRQVSREALSQASRLAVRLAFQAWNRQVSMQVCRRSSRQLSRRPSRCPSREIGRHRGQHQVRPPGLQPDTNLSCGTSRWVGGQAGVRQSSWWSSRLLFSWSSWLSFGQPSWLWALPESCVGVQVIGQAGVLIHISV